MKKYLPYLIVLAVIALFMLLLLQNTNPVRRFDERLTFDKTDKRPYGSFVAFNNLKHLFPGATISTNNKQPGFWDSLSDFGDDQLLVIICPRFDADEYHLKRLMNFVKNGNYIFISTKLLSADAESFFHTESITTDFALPKFTEPVKDSLVLKFRHPPFPVLPTFFYPGFRYDSYFLTYDSSISRVLGVNDANLPNFVEFSVGEGKVFLHLAPLAFSNYFLLHRKNIDYYNEAMSVVPQSIDKLVWDEYFLYKKNESQSDDGTDDGRGALYRLMRDPAFSAAFWLLLCLLLLYIFQESRRKQRFIPEFSRPRNDSLEFVKTIGRLYHEKADNRNLSRKMSAYFLEHVRNRYKLPTGKLDEIFILSLQRKTGQPEAHIREIVSFINKIDDRTAVTDDQLSAFHDQLERFYKGS